MKPSRPKARSAQAPAANQAPPSTRPPAVALKLSDWQQLAAIEAGALSQHLPEGAHLGVVANHLLQELTKIAPLISVESQVAILGVASAILMQSVDHPPLGGAAAVFLASIRRGGQHG